MTSSHRQHRSFRRPLATLGVFALFAGMLFWTKLRLVSDIPRTAYAVPEDESAAPSDDQAVDTGESSPETAGGPVAIPND